MKNVYPSLFFLFTTLISFGQSQIQGTVKNATDQAPVDGAIIYVVELDKGAVSNAQGQYSLNGIGAGSYHLQVSYLGFAPVIKEVSIINAKDDTIDFELSPRPFVMDEIVVSSAFLDEQRDNVYKIDVLNKDNMQREGAVTIMDMIEDVLGVDAVTTGPLVSRPVIRGLSGNRVLTVVDGSRFETQQWDDEHGLGVNELGVDHIEIIKGPASLLYGPEAIGGVIRLVEEKPAAVGTREGQASATLFSNNLGARANVGVKEAKENFNWGVNALGRLLSDYFYNGYDFRVPNTRLMEYGGKAYAGVNGKWGSTKLSYLFNKAYYGILDGKDIVKDEDGRIVNIDSLEKEKFPMEIEAPFHAVTDNRISSKTTLLTGASKIDAVLSYQNNHRSENEELSGHKKGYTYVDMVLQTATYDVKWHLPKMENLETIVGIQGMFQKNKNQPGAETLLVPDASIRDFGFLAVAKYNLSGLMLSAGARYDKRWLEAQPYQDEFLTFPDVSRDYDNLSYSVGLNYNLNDVLQLRSSFASGYRAHNLNELFANGFKLESQRFERGNIDFEKEYNNQLDVSITYTQADLTLEGAAFLNSIHNFIYLAPTGETVENNLEPGEEVPLYDFLQEDAEIKGFEASLDIHPSSIAWGHLVSRFSTLTGKLKDDSYLPMMSPTRLYNTMYLNLDHISRLEDAFIDIGTETAFKQAQTAENEMNTPAYTLLNAALGGHIKKTEIILSAHNILDKAYLDHMSRFRSYEIISPGLNISLSVKMPLDI